jgi:GGDEF domain-containing protein
MRVRMTFSQSRLIHQNSSVPAGGKRIVELQQKLVSANEALRYAARHDFLTRLWNRAAIIAFLQRETARSLREGRAFGVILVDVDHIKKVNDELGHETGDYVLQEIAKRFSASLREYDGIGRYGGEEFLLVMPGLGPGNDITSCQSDQRVDLEYADPDSCPDNNGHGQHGGCRRSATSSESL